MFNPERCSRLLQTLLFAQCNPTPPPPYFWFFVAGGPCLKVSQAKDCIATLAGVRLLRGGHTIWSSSEKPLQDRVDPAISSVRSRE